MSRPCAAQRRTAFARSDERAVLLARSAAHTVLYGSRDARRCAFRAEGQAAERARQRAGTARSQTATEADRAQTLAALQ